MTTTEPYICVYFGDGSCNNCGGARTAGGYRYENGRMIKDPSIPIGPFEAPDGTKDYCSEECWEDAEEFVARERTWRATEYCTVCGFDRHEHAPDCKAAQP